MYYMIKIDAYEDNPEYIKKREELNRPLYMPYGGEQMPMQYFEHKIFETILTEEEFKIAKLEILKAWQANKAL